MSGLAESIKQPFNAVLSQNEVEGLPLFSDWPSGGAALLMQEGSFLLVESCQTLQIGPHHIRNPANTGIVHQFINSAASFLSKFPEAPPARLPGRFCCEI